jgi:hypothetical protein
MKINFITGIPRSGTTILGKLVGNHPDVVEFNELTFLSFIKDSNYLMQLNIKSDEINNFLFENLKKITYSYIKDLYLETGKVKNQNAEVLIEKDPMLTAYPELLHEFFPESKIVHIVRDPLYIGESYKRFINNLKDDDIKRVWGTYGDIDLTIYDPHIRGVMAWISYKNRFSQYNLLNNSENYLEINYNDFITNPQNIISNIYKFFNLKDYELDESVLLKINKTKINISNYLLDCEIFEIKNLLNNLNI